MTNADWTNWPTARPPAEADAKVFEARLADLQERKKSNRALVAAAEAAEVASLDKYVTALYGLATASIDRVRAGAENVQKGSAAVAALYSGVLAVTFSVKDNPLPLRGLLAPVFLGLAVVLSTIFLSYINAASDPSRGPEPAEGLELRSFSRVNSYITIAAEIAERRVYFLRASVLALGVGLVFISAPFISVSRSTAAEIPAAAAEIPATAATDAGSPSAAPAVPTSAAMPDWPPVPTVLSGNLELEKIQYQARVAEVAAARAKTPEAVEADDTRTSVDILLVGGLIGGLVVFLVPLLWRTRRTNTPATMAAAAEVAPPHEPLHH